MRGKTGATNRPTPTEAPLNGATPPQPVPDHSQPQNARYGAPIHSTKQPAAHGVQVGVLTGLAYDVGMKCQRCGFRAVASSHGGRRCLMCGYEEATTELVPLVVASRRCDVAVRTVRRWIDAGMVPGNPPTGSGRVRMVDVVSLAAYTGERRTALRTCEKRGADIGPTGVRRASRIHRRWCGGSCKNDYHHTTRDRRRVVA